MTDPTTKAEPIVCNRCGHPKPEHIDHLWACCGDGPGYRDIIKPETVDCLRRQLAEANAKLEAAERELAHCREAAELLAQELWNEGDARNGPQDYCGIAERIRTAVGGNSNQAQQDEGENLGPAARDLGDKAIRLEVQLAELRAENARLVEKVRRLTSLACDAKALLGHQEFCRPLPLNWLRSKIADYEDWLRSNQAKAAEPEATAAVDAYECNCPAPYPEAVHDLSCPEHLKRFPEDRPLSPDVARAAEAVEAQDPMLRPVTFGKLVDVIREVRTGFGGPAGELASELAKHLEHRATGGGK